MTEETKGKIFDYLTTHRYLALATVTADGKPMVHTMCCTSQATTVYYATWK